MAAAAHGLPVIAVQNAENQAEFAHGENVWVVEASQAELFTAAIAHLAEDAALRERLGRNLRQLYEARFAWSHTLPAPAFAADRAPAGAPINQEEKHFR